MSFDLNLSSDEEDLGKWEKERDAFLAANLPSNDTNEADEKEGDEDSIDWQDAGDDDSVEWEDVEDTKPPARLDVQAESVTIDFQAEKDPPKRKRKRVQRRKLRLESLDERSQSLLRDLNTTHLLALMAHTVHVSRLCNDDLLCASALSIVPDRFNRTPGTNPTYGQVKELSEWYFDLVHGVERRRNAVRARNRRAGAPRTKNPRRSKSSSPVEASLQSAVEYAHFLSPIFDEDPQLYHGTNVFHDDDKVRLFVSLLRAIGWRARVASVLDPMPIDLDANHPILKNSTNFFWSVRSKKSTGKAETVGPVETTEDVLVWVEILCLDKGEKPRWIHADPIRSSFDDPVSVETVFASRKESSVANTAIPYVLAVEHRNSVSVETGLSMKAIDVTPRYARSFVESLRARGDIRNKKSLVAVKERRSWFSETLEIINQTRKTGKTADQAIEIEVSGKDHVDDHENEELKKSAADEALPTSKAAFQTHPLYVIPSVLGKTEVLHPDAKKRVCGMFKGQMVYRRSDVSVARPATKWLYEGRKVREEEISKPVKQVKARKKAVGKAFKALKSYGVGASNDGSEEQREAEIEIANQPLDDEMERLYGIWQTDQWSPGPVGPMDPIPVNEYNNIELALLNPGLVHIDIRGIAPVAKKLGIPYAPCLLGFEGHGGNRTPTVRGIVVHAHNAELLREAGAEVVQHQTMQEEKKRRDSIYLRWKLLLRGLLTKERIEAEYKDKS